MEIKDVGTLAPRPHRTSNSSPGPSTTDKRAERAILVRIDRHRQLLPDRTIRRLTVVRACDRAVSDGPLDVCAPDMSWIDSSDIRTATAVNVVPSYRSQTVLMKRSRPMFR